MNYEENDARYRNRNTENSNDGGTETVEEMRARLNTMKQLMREKNNAAANNLNAEVPTRRAVGIIDDSFLSVVFTFVLIVIVGVSTYAFYNLYNAVVKKFGPRHDEL